MNTTILAPVAINDTAWTELQVPDRARDSVSFQLDSLGVVLWSMDGGLTSMKAVGTGETLSGNFSLKSLWFKAELGNELLLLRYNDQLVTLGGRHSGV